MTGILASDRTIDWNTYKWPLSVAWASSQHGSYVPKRGVPEGSIWKEDILREPRHVIMAAASETLRSFIS